MSEGLAFSGILGTARIDEKVAHLRFHPFVFDLTPEAKPVLEIEFRNPFFNLNDLASLIDSECEVEISGAAIQLYCYFEGDKRELRADQVSASWRPYDLTDYRNQIDRLRTLERTTDEKLREVNGRNRNAVALIEELSRRADLKAQASPEQANTQNAVTSALAWVKSKLTPPEK